MPALLEQRVANIQEIQNYRVRRISGIQKLASRALVWCLRSVLISIQLWIGWLLGRRFPPEQSLDRHVHIHFLSFPQRNGSLWCNPQAGFAVLAGEGKNVSAERFFAHLRDRAAGRVGEFRDALVAHLDAVAAFVHQAVVMATEQDEVVHFRFSAVGPVLDMVGVNVLVGSAAGETAAVIAALQGAAYGGRNRAAAPADVQSVAIFILVPVYDAAVASQAARRFRGDLCAGIQPALGAFAVLAQGIEIGVHVNGRALAAIRAGLTAKKPFGHARKRVGPALRDRFADRIFD